VNSKIRRCAIAASLSLMTLPGSTLVAGDTYYRWNDASGNPVNSDRPPEAGVEYDVITTNTNLKRRANPMEDFPQVENSSLNKKLEGDTPSAQAPVAKKDPEACNQARLNLETLTTSARIRVSDGKGNYRYLNEDEKQTQRNNAEAVIAKDCDLSVSD
jgi:hypothetical protein